MGQSWPELRRTPPKRHPHPSLLGALSQLCATALAGCGTVSITGAQQGATSTSEAAAAPSVTSTAATAPTSVASPSSTTPMTSSTAGGPCAGQALSGRLATMDGAAGHVHLVIALRNAGAAACTLDGYPTVGLVGADGTALPVRLTHDGDMAFPATKPARVTLAPGAVASFDIGFGHVPGDGETSCPEARSLRVTPPGDTHAVTVAATVDPCDSGHLAVSPLVAGDQGTTA